MKSVSIGKAAVLALLTMVTVGSFVMLAEGRQGKTAENTSAGAPTATQVYIREHTFGGSNRPEYAIPSGNTSFKSYMDYRTITNRDSEQYALQEGCWTDDDGLRRYGDYYVVALGSYYADNIGDKFIITLEDGEEFAAIVGDFKADRHTDQTNRYTPMQNGGKNIIEFVVDTHTLDDTARQMGDISYIYGFGGNVRSIEREQS